MFFFLVGMLLQEQKYDSVLSSVQYFKITNIGVQDRVKR